MLHNNVSYYIISFKLIIRVQLHEDQLQYFAIRRYFIQINLLKLNYSCITQYGPKIKELTRKH